MGIFGTKKKEEKIDVKKDSKGSVRASTPHTREAHTLANTIAHPRITEKSAVLSEGNVYTFIVDANSTKTEIKKAMKSIYKVHPTKVNVLQMPSKRISSRRGGGVRSGVRKAFVYLKKGESIEFI